MPATINAPPPFSRWSPQGRSGPAVMPVNIIAPYLLTALVRAPRRLVHLSSSSHYGGRPSTAKVDWRGQRAGSYEDSKLFVTTLAATVARLRPNVLANAVDPGWVPTKMGGAGARDDLELGHQTKEWLAVSDQPEALTTGGYWYHRQRREPHAAVHDQAFQEHLLRPLPTRPRCRSRPDDHELVSRQSLRHATDCTIPRTEPSGHAAVSTRAVLPMIGCAPPQNGRSARVRLVA